MRRRLRVLALAISVVVSLAFLLPLLLAIRSYQRDTAVVAATEMGRDAAFYLVVDDPARLQNVYRNLGFQDAPNRLEVWYPDGRAIASANTATGPLPDTVRAAFERPSMARTSVRNLGGGVEIVLPPRTTEGEPRVVRVLVPASELSKGVAAKSMWLLAVAVALVLASVAAADRVAGMPSRNDRRPGRPPRLSPFGGPTAAGAAD